MLRAYILPTGTNLEDSWRADAVEYVGAAADWREAFLLCADAAVEIHASSGEFDAIAIDDAGYRVNRATIG